MAYSMEIKRWELREDGESLVVLVVVRIVMNSSIYHKLLTQYVGKLPGVIGN